MDKKINNSNIIKEKLDLTNWWQEITIDEVENIINKKDKWAYYRLTKDGKWISTIKDLKVTNHRTWEVDIQYPENREIPKLKEEIKTEILTILELDPTRQAKGSMDAYERAKWSDEKVFWFYTKWKNKAIMIVDYTDIKHPKRKSYPLDKYQVKYKTIKI